MPNAECDQNAPQLSASSCLNHAEHVVDSIRPLAARPVTQAPHAIEPNELFCGQTVEITEAADHATLHQLRKQLLADALKVKRATTNRIAQCLEVLRWAGAIRAAMPNFVSHHFGTAGRAARRHRELGEWRGAALSKPAHHLRNHIARLLQHDDVPHANILAANLIDIVQRGSAHR